MTNNTNKNEAFFKGVETYQESDKDKFYGRKVEVQQLLYKVEHCDWCVCYARSGEGKSSLINAGLIPTLRDQRMFPISIRFEVDSNGYLQDVDFDDYIWKIIESYDNLFYTDSFIFDSNEEINEKLWWRLRTKIFRIKTEGSIYNTVLPVLIFDQFEEVFTKPKNFQWTYKFFEWLEELYKDEIPTSKNDEMPLGISEHSFPKRFKALFSLRNEYVSELDYWSMERFFIPSLKNNRYYLKPLTIAAGKEVTQKLINWPQGIGVDDVIKAATDDKFLFLEENEERNTEKHPQGPSCVSAHILSLVLSKLEESDEFVRQKLIEIIDKGKPTDNQKEFMEKLFDHIYEEALLHSRVGLKSSLRDRLEEELIDDNGRRRRPHIGDLEKEEDLVKVIKQLEKERIVCINNGEVELSHDSISATVARHRTKRITQLKEQREEFIASLVIIPLAIVLSIFLSKLFHSKDLVVNMRLFDINSVLVLANLSIMPVLIYSAIKKYKTTSWLSLYGLLSNAVLIYLFLKGQTKEMGLRWSLTAVSVGIPVITLTYSYHFRLFGKITWKELKSILTSIPLLSFFLIISVYLFYIFVFNDWGLVQPKHSFWGVLVIPLLVFGILRNASKQKTNIIGFIIYLCLLSVLAINALYLPFILPFSMFLCVLCFILVSLIWMYRHLVRFYRVASVLFSYLIVCITVFINIGFNPFLIKYQQVQHVNNWVTTTIKGEGGKLGIVDAWSGEIILPCEFDSVTPNNCYIFTQALSYNKSYIDAWNTFSFDSTTHRSIYNCKFFPKLEKKIFGISKLTEIGKSLNDSILFYAARTYRELRNANVAYSRSGIIYSIDDIHSYPILSRLQKKQFYSVLDSVDKKTNTENVVRLNKELARTFYVLMVKDRIIQKDGLNLFMLAQEFIPLYFFDLSDFSFDFSVYTVINFNGLQRDFHDEITMDVLRKNDLDSWYGMLSSLLALDLGFNNSSYINNEMLQQLLEDLKGERKKQQESTDILQDIVNNENASLDNLEMACKMLWANKQSLKNCLDRTNDYFNEMITGKKEVDNDFKEMLDSMFKVLSPMVQHTNKIYNSVFEQICQDLYIVGAMRQYDGMSKYRDELDRMARSHIYYDFKAFQESLDNNRRVINELLKDLLTEYSNAHK